MAFDLCMAVTPICFIALAVMAIWHSGREEFSYHRDTGIYGDESEVTFDSTVQVIMNAARFVSLPRRFR